MLPVTSSRSFLLACLLAAALLGIAYANHFRNDFHFDDAHTIQNNLYIRDLANIPEFFRNPRTFSSLPANQSYRPLLSTTLAIDYRLGGGLNPLAFHITSFALLALQCIAMLLLFRRLMDRARPHPWNRWIALFGATWYAVHTANAETVNYIIARSDILSTCFTVLAVLLFTGNGVGRRWHLYLIPAAAAVFSKEQGVMVAPMLFLYVGIFERGLSLPALLRPRNVAAVLRVTWPAFVLCTAILAAGMRMSTTFTPGGSRWPYLMAQPFVLLHYALTFVLPANLSADTDWQPITNPFDDRLFVGLVFIALSLWATVVTSRRRETWPIAFGILWFYAALLPSSSVIPFSEVMNDHRLYFPYVGVVLAASWSLGLWLMNREPMLDARRWMRPVVVAAALVLLCAHAYGTWQRNVVWRTEESLWLDVTKKSPQNGRGLMTYGVIQMGKGNYDSAEQYFTRALQYAPLYSYLHVNLGVLHGARGNKDEAERYFRNGQKYAPGDPVSYYYYARWLDSVGRTGEAVPLVQRALALSPGHVEARSLSDQIAARAGRTPSAPLPRPALPPDSRTETPEQWLALSLTQYQAGRFEESIASTREALRLRPGYAEAYNNMCAASNALRRYADAVAACERAIALRSDFPLAKNNLAYAQSQLPR